MDRQTDRQTVLDKEFKTRHWKSGIFDDENTSSKGNWLKLDNPPDGFKIYVCDELCPTTGRPHKQVHVDCGRQQRLTKLTKWLSATKWIPVLGADHVMNSVNYCQEKSKKAKGTIAGSSQIIHGAEYLTFDKILMSLASKVEDMPTYEEVEKHAISCGLKFNSQKYYDKYDIVRSWSVVSGLLVDEDVTWVNKLSNPAIKLSWETWGHIFIRKYKQEKSSEGTLGGVSIIERPEDVSVKNL